MTREEFYPYMSQKLAFSTEPMGLQCNNSGQFVKLLLEASHSTVIKSKEYGLHSYYSLGLKGQLITKLFMPLSFLWIMHVMPPTSRKSQTEINPSESVLCDEECHLHYLKNGDINHISCVDCNDNLQEASTQEYAVLLSQDEPPVQWNSSSDSNADALGNNIQQASYGTRSKMKEVDMHSSYLQIFSGHQDNNLDASPVCCCESHTEIQYAKTHTNLHCSGLNIYEHQEERTCNDQEGTFLQLKNVENLCHFLDLPNRDHEKEFSQVCDNAVGNSSNNLKTVVIFQSSECSLYNNAACLQINKHKNPETASGVCSVEQTENISSNLEDTPFDISVQTSASNLTEISLKISDGTAKGKVENNVNGQECQPQGKLKDIISYLDEIEHSSTEVKDFISPSQCTFSERQKDRIYLEETLRNNYKAIEETTSKDEARLTQHVKTLELQLEDRDRCLLLARQAISQQQEALKQSKHKMELKIRSCKKDYEDVVLRHQKFIDQLIADKEALNEKCKSLLHELKVAESRYTSNLKAAEERHCIDIKKVREMHAAAEKVRRDKWIEIKTKKIKEMTVKGLEPELNRMSEQHEKELSELRAQHEKEMYKAQQDAAQQLREQAQLLQEESRRRQLEETAHEAARIKARYEKQLEELEELQQQQRNKLLAEFSKEKDCFTKERKKHMDELRKLKESLNSEKLEEIKQLECKWSESVKQLEIKHQTELQMVKETLEMQKAAWMHDCEKMQKLYLLEKETEIREEYKRNRDREIEKAIEKLEEDCERMKSETEKAAEAKALRLKEQYEADVRELETVISTLRSKCDDIKEKLDEREGELAHLNTSIRQLQKELSESQKLIEQFSSERANVKEIIRKEFLSQIIILEEENIQLREQMAEMRAYHQMEISAKEKELRTAAADKEQEFQELYKRVKAAIAKKEKAIQQLNLKYEAALEQCTHLENVLEQHQRDHLFR
ncbi:centrosomal protein of 131 kDa [Schistocerca cancellata]|uniref:centrosomal protein of 131 kDa n=1 Tax=Schistocerca cancellata TaxID=274614 RepID=UPI00211990BB|nr:centrosomal protein of 131 kDa [Schistocerca cancellata]